MYADTEKKMSIKIERKLSESHFDRIYCFVEHTHMVCLTKRLTFKTIYSE